MNATKIMDYIKKAQIALVVLAAILFIFGCVSSSEAGKKRENERLAREAAEGIEISITEKTNDSWSSSYAEFNFDFVIKNGCDVGLEYISGVFKVMDQEGNLLTSGDTYFGTSIISVAHDPTLDANEEKTYTLSWRMDSSENSEKIWKSDFGALSVSFEVKKIRVAKGETVDVVREPFVKPCDDALELSYQDAVALFNQGEYIDAASIFEALGYYKDSQDYYYLSIYNNALVLYSQEKYGEAYQALKTISSYSGVSEKLNEITETVLAKAEAYAAAGDYVAAYTIIEQVEYYENSTLHREYYNMSVYSDALALYAQDKYGEAYQMLKSIISFSDVEEKMDEIVSVVRAKAEACANVGDYAAACALVEQVEYDESTNVYKAYLYASNGEFSKAVGYGLTVVVIPEGVETIPDNFLKTSYSNQLRKVVLPSTVKSIGYSAFYGCSNLAEINLPDGLQTIKGYAFYGCKIESLQMPDSLLGVGTNAFEGCTSLGSVTTSRGLTKISSYAFKGCTNLTTVTIKEGVELIESSAFYGCTSLMEIKLPESLVEIQSSAFALCTSLSEITLPANMRLIANRAFSDCSILQKVIFANTVGWSCYGTAVDVSNSQNNARALRGANPGIWEREEV